MGIPRPCVIDIYHEDPVLDFSLTKVHGIVGVIHKVSEGTNADPLYGHRRGMWMNGEVALVTNLDGSVTKYPVKWGGYHYIHDGGGATQAEFFVEHANPDADTLLAIDWEKPDGQQPASIDTVVTFATRVFAMTGRWPVLYSGNVAKEALGSRRVDFFARMRLWLAQYGSIWSTQASWPVPWLWQNDGDTYGPGPHQIPGIAGECDNNCIVAGTIQNLLDTWSGTPVSVV